MTNTQDTISAIATPVGHGGIGIIRISGSEAFFVSSKVFISSSTKVENMKSHTAHYGKLIDPKSGSEIDDVILTIFKTPKSYTGEDVAEISCHGGSAVLKSALCAVLNAGARLAEPGEFTKRAFLNGKIDLAQAEAVNDLIRAGTDGARKVALRQLDGKLSERIKAANEKILGIIAAIEAAIDFPDDVDEPENSWLADEICAAKKTIKSLLDTSAKGRIYREGLRMVIAGQVNVGKSSLMNALLRHARAIVTPIPGTTRDVIEESLEIQGIPIVAIDTAGLRQTDDPVEKIGVEMTEKSLDSADLALVVVDASKKPSSADAELFAKVENLPAILVINKIDLLDENRWKATSESYLNKLGRNMKYVFTSASSGDGIEILEEEIASIASAADTGESVFVSNVRHQRLLNSAMESLGKAEETLQNAEPIDFLSIDLTAARNSLGLITGETASEGLIDRIFSEFCIGK